MKLSKKKVFVLALAVCLIATLSMSTLAWFTDEDYVKNDFMIADSDDDTADEIFSIDVWEKNPGTAEGEKDQDGYEYKDILPGDILKKEVFVENTGYYDQYVRVTVTVSDGAAWMSALNITDARRMSLDKIVEGYDPNNGPWSVHSIELNSRDELVYTLYLSRILDGDDTTTPENEGVVTLFTAVKVPTSLTVEQAAAFKTAFQIQVKAEAVQTKNLGVDPSNNINDAHEAFVAVGLA